MPTVDQPAPALSLLKDKSTVVDLADLRGQKVVVAFVPGAFTGVCTKEICAFRDAAGNLESLEATVLVVDVDGPFANAAWAAANSFNFPVLSDFKRNAVRAWDVAHDDFAGIAGYTAAKRSVFIVDREGVLRWQWVAPNPGVEPDYAEIQRVLGTIA